MEKNTIITEDNIKIKIPEQLLITKKDNVFFNPEMKFNRDISCLVLERDFISKNKNAFAYRVCDLMSATGIRGMRYFNALKNLSPEFNFEIYFNDIKQDAISSIKENLKLNNLKEQLKNKIFITQKNAHNLILSEKFDFVDIDPFGSSIYFLNSFFANAMHNSILATTYTDTAPLCGTYPKTCFIRYFAKPARIDNMHELALRILIAKANIIASMHEKTYSPLISFSKSHYFRLFGSVKKSSKGKIKEHLKNIGYLLYCKKCMEKKFIDFDLLFNSNKANKKCSCGADYDYAGPLWVGDLHNSEFCQKILPNAKDENTKKFIEILIEENKFKGICYNIHKLAKSSKIKLIKTNELIFALQKNKFKATRCQFGGEFIKTNKILNNKEYEKLVKKQN